MSPTDEDDVPSDLSSCEMRASQVVSSPTMETPLDSSRSPPVPAAITNNECEQQFRESINNNINVVDNTNTGVIDDVANWRARRQIDRYNHNWSKGGQELLQIPSKDVTTDIDTKRRNSPRPCRPSSTRTSCQIGQNLPLESDIVVPLEEDDDEVSNLTELPTTNRSPFHVSLQRDHLQQQQEHASLPQQQQQRSYVPGAVVINADGTVSRRNVKNHIVGGQERIDEDEDDGHDRHDNDNGENCGTGSTKRISNRIQRNLILIGALSTVILVSIILALVRSDNSKGGDGIGQRIFKPTRIKLESILSIDDINSLLDGATPQSKGLSWIIHDDTESSKLLSNINITVIMDEPDVDTDEYEQITRRIQTRFALAVFYFSTTISEGEHSIVNSTSNTSAVTTSLHYPWCDQLGFLSPMLHECGWHETNHDVASYSRTANKTAGVICDPVLQTVTGLIFGTSSQIYLSQIWFRICTSAYVALFIMSDQNCLHGTIPIDISFLTNLTDLNLPGNNVSGFLPESLSQLTK